MAPLEQPNHDTPAIQQLRGYLNHRLRVAITDGRVVVGTFMCVDGQKNIVLAGTSEILNERKRNVGLILVPGKHIVKVEVEKLDIL